MKTFNRTVKTGILVKLLLGLLFSSTPAFARRHRVSEPHLFPTAGSLQLQNEEVDRERLPRIKTKDELREFISDGELIPFPSSPALRVHIPHDRAYARPWVVTFVTAMAEDYYRVFGTPLQINSAVRTVQDQKRLRRWNRNAAPATGPLSSVHPTGIAVDLQRRGLTGPELRWLRIRLLIASARQNVIVEEERRFPCFHVVVRMTPGEVLPNLALSTPVTIE